MKSRFEGHCKRCDKPWYKGSTIAILLGEWVHSDCKAQHLSELRSGATPVALPGNRGAIERWESRKQVTSHRARRGIPFSGL